VVAVVAHRVHTVMLWSHGVRPIRPPLLLLPLLQALNNPR